VNLSSIQAKIASGLAYIVSVFVLLHPGFKQPTWVTALIPILGLLVAGGVQLYDLITHHIAMAAVATGLTAKPPFWASATWITQFIKTVITAVVGIIALVHPGFTEPVWVESSVVSVSGLLVILVPYLDTVLTKKVAALKVLKHP
jgi:hypothetical protein